MVLEFLSEADASSAFKINNAGDLLNKIKEHPLKELNNVYLRRYLLWYK